MRKIDPWRIAETFTAVFLALLVWSLLFLSEIAG
jgi:hypothetical protein